MKQWNWDRIAAAMGFVFVGLFLIAFFTFGESPTLGDSPEEVAAYFEDDRGRVVTGAIFFGLGGIAFLWFTAALATILRNAGEVRLGATVLASGAAVVAVALVLFGLTGAQVLGVAEADPDSAWTINVITWAFQVAISWPVAAFALATTIGAWRAGFFPKWLSWASLAGSVALALGGTTLAKDGFWAADGGYSFITIVVFLVWVLVTSWVFMQRVTTAQAPRPATAAV